MRFVNLTNKEIKVRQPKNTFLILPPTQEKIKIKAELRFTACNQTRAYIDKKDDEVKIYDCDIVFSNLPPKKWGTYYIVPRWLQFFLFKFARRNDFVCVMGGRLCLIKRFSKHRGSKKTLSVLHKIINVPRGTL